MCRLRGFVKTILYPQHLRRTCLLSLIIGTWLTAFNQGDVIFNGDLGVELWAKIILNYLTPFLVANLGLLSGNTRVRSKDSKEYKNSEIVKVYEGH